MRYIKKILNNGLRIIMVPLQDTETVTVMALAETGSEYEKESENGISHFLEHMCFKGTVKRPTSLDISLELDNLGSANNAFTSNDHTGFYAKAHSDKTEQLIDIVADIYLNSSFPEEEIKKEKGVVIEEINMYEDRPQSKVWDILAAAVFPNQSAGRTVLGTKETVSNITRDDLIAYHKKHYVPEATVLVVSGKINEEKVFAKIEEQFGRLEKAERIPKPPVVQNQTAPLVKLHHKKSDQTHFVIAFRSFVDLYDARVYTAGMLAAILSKGMSSRLFQKIREELGLAYYISAGHNPEIDYGVFTINAGVSNSKLTKAIEAIMSELRKLKEELVPEAELRKIKDLRKGHLYLGLESSDAWADFYGFQEIYREPILTPEEIIARREAVTAEDLKKLAGEIFKPENVTIAIVGPQKDEKAVYDTISLQ